MTRQNANCASPERDCGHWPDPAFGYDPMTGEHLLDRAAYLASRQRSEARGCAPTITPPETTELDRARAFVGTGVHRWPVTRTGQRRDIARYVRAAVYMRDGYVCNLCGVNLRGHEKHLDHVIPWSAGGSDRSANLRTTCPACNENRSNIVDIRDTRHRLPVTWWCIACWSLGSRKATPTWAAELGEPLWRERAPAVDPDLEDLTLAWCAACGMTGYTNRPL